MQELKNIQSKINAPKNQYNEFGNYYYRSAEDICEALKPLLKEEDCYVTLDDELVLIGERYYVKAIATIVNSEGSKVSNTAFAREPLSEKGKSESMVTGSASSFARKYAMNGLFLIDDVKDADTQNNNDKPDLPDKVIQSMKDLSLEEFKKKSREVREKYNYTSDQGEILNAIYQYKKDETTK